MAVKSRPPAVRAVVDSGAGVIAILANSTVMLTKLEMICVQFVSVKIMTIAYATVTSQVTQILFFFLYFRNIILFKVFHIFLGFKCQVSGVR
jgi:hypothetical protein